MQAVSVINRNNVVVFFSLDFVVVDVVVVAGTIIVVVVIVITVIVITVIGVGLDDCENFCDIKIYSERICSEGPHMFSS